VAAEAAQVHRHWLARCPERYSRRVLERLRAAEQVSGADYLEGRRLAALWTRAWRRTFAEHQLDAVASPTIAQPPRVIPASAPGQGPSLHLTKAWSVNGFPSASVPVAVDDRGLPVGLMLASLPEQEDDLVGIAITLDEDVQMFRRSPPQAAAG
jgi:aspartyl-tRNA(Asn)/glutamyl-tRNA(Gln) amidotransferase subunit A